MDIQTKNASKVFEAIKAALQSYYVPPFVLAFCFIFWLARLNLVCICALVLVVAAILVFCDDVKNIFCPALFAGFCIKDIAAEANWFVYIGCVVAALIAFVAFAVTKIAKRKGSLKLGKMFYPIIVLDVAFLLGGIVGNFNVSAFFATLGLSVAMLLLYFLAINFTENLADYLAVLFVYGAAFVSLQILTKNVIDNGFHEIFECHGWATAEGPNTSALFIGLGAVSALFLINVKKRGYLFLIPAAIYIFMVTLIRCRGMLLTLLIVIPVEAVLVVKNCKTKRALTFTLLGILVASAIAELTTHCISDAIKGVIEKFINNKSSGRLGDNQLWDWCINKFFEYPIFGYGFISAEPVPSIRAETQYFILAHNTVLQLMTSVGIFGMILAGWFYFEKYTLAFTDFKGLISMPLLLIVIAMSGITEQAAMMDPFVFLIPFILLAAKENYLAEKAACAEQAVVIGNSCRVFADGRVCGVTVCNNGNEKGNTEL